jgi:hypothetical protein
MAIRYNRNTLSMRNCFIICLVLFFGCGKEPGMVQAPECKLASISKYGYAFYPLTYNGTKIVKVGDDSSTNTVLTYNNTGRLSTIEQPSNNPIYKTELFYNGEDKVRIEKNFEKSVNNWVESSVFYFTYTNGKVSEVRETVQWASPALEFDYEIIWDGNNIRSIIIRSGAAVICTHQYSYDTTRKNPINAFIDLYYVDKLRSNFKMPFYFSANMLMKEDTNCPSVLTTNFTYDLSDSLHIKVYTNGNEYLAYNYECR